MICRICAWRTQTTQKQFETYYRYSRVLGLRPHGEPFSLMAFGHIVALPPALGRVPSPTPRHVAHGFRIAITNCFCKHVPARKKGTGPENPEEREGPENPRIAITNCFCKHVPARKKGMGPESPRIAITNCFCKHVPARKKGTGPENPEESVT